MSSRFIPTHHGNDVWVFYDRKTAAKYYVKEGDGDVYLDIDVTGKLRAPLPGGFKLERIPNGGVVSDEAIRRFVEYFRKHVEYF